MLSPLGRLTLSRRRLVQSTGAAVAASQLPFWSVVTHAQSGDTAELVSGNTDFALDLYTELRQTTDGNLLVSPYSVSLALAMVYLGAEGETATQMADTLGFTLDPSDLAAAFRGLSSDLEERGTVEEDEDKGVAARGLSIANSLWGEASYPFSQGYMVSLDDSFGAELNLVDFADAPDDARVEINDWVADHTNDRIEDIVPEGAITADTRLVLANAIWFAGAWRSSFQPDNTAMVPSRCWMARRWRCRSCGRPRDTSTRRVTGSRPSSCRTKEVALPSPLCCLTKASSRQLRSRSTAMHWTRS